MCMHIESAAMAMNQPRINADTSSVTTLHDEDVSRTSESQSSTSTLPDDHLHQHQHQHQHHFDEDVEGNTSDFYFARRWAFVGSFFRVLGMTVRRRRRQNGGFDDYFTNASRGASPRIFLPKSRHGSPREVRRGRRRHVASFLKRALLVLPVLALMFFGLLYLIQVLLGEARLFWDIDALEEYLPNWGKPGYAGQDLSQYPTDATRDVTPIPCHSHNDYWRRIPLFEALHTGCTSVEADVWLFDEELYVGHSTSSLTPNRTFSSLYITPLVTLLDSMNPDTTFTNPPTPQNGVFDTSPNQTLILLIDIKTHGPSTYPHLLRHLAPLREKNYLTHHDGTTLHQRPITLVGTGKTPFPLLSTPSSPSSPREIFYDAPLTSLTTETYNTTNTYYASTPFSHSIGFPYRGHLTSSQLSTLRKQISTAHAAGLKVRFWDTPSWPRWVRDGVWETLWEEGVDVLNVDDLKGVKGGRWGLRVRE